MDLNLKTFRAFPEAIKALPDSLKNKTIVTFCTGGIRCEKASAYLKHHGFEDVNQLQGGIIHYARQVEKEGLTNKFKGKNFVFDERLGERIGTEIISKCHQCGKACDTHVNCMNDDCHLLFIQCDDCAKTHEGCCSTKCTDIKNLPIEEQRQLRKGQNKIEARNVYKSRLRPKLGKE